MSHEPRTGVVVIRTGTYVLGEAEAQFHLPQRSRATLAISDVSPPSPPSLGCWDEHHWRLSTNQILAFTYHHLSDCDASSHWYSVAAN